MRHQFICHNKISKNLIPFFWFVFFSVTPSSFSRTDTSHISNNSNQHSKWELTSSVTLSLPDTGIFQGTMLDMPIRMTGLSVKDSVLAYQITLGFDYNVALAIGATAGGTMTSQWSGPITGIKKDKILITDFTTNKTGSQLVPDSGILVKISFLARGVPPGEALHSTVVTFIKATILTLNGEITVSNTRNGLIVVAKEGTSVEKNLFIYPGWNLISLSIIPEPSSVPEIFGDIPVDYVYGYWSGDGPISWDHIRPSYLNDLKSLDGLHGYWIKANITEQKIWHFAGDSIPVTTPILLYPGLNLIGYLPSSPDSVSHAFQSLGKLYSYVGGYQEEDAGPQVWARNRPSFLNDLNVLSPSSGYWIKMDSARTLVYPSGGYVASKGMVTPMQLTKATIENIEPQSCDFWARQPEVLSEGDTVKVYDSNNVLCGKSTVINGGFLVHVSGDDPYTTDIDEGAVRGERLHFFVNSDSAVVLGVSANFDSVIIMGQEATFENMSSKRIKLMMRTTNTLNHRRLLSPHEISLAQNYPNPFNAETVISYRVPTQCKVTLRIFDTNGRLVRTLVKNRLVQPGEHRIIWDGCDANGIRAASGIYLDQLQAGKIIRNNKMVLIY